MKQLAARDFEDLLQVCHNFPRSVYLANPVNQCAMPVFEHLLPDPHNKIVLDLLFDLATWHAYAKLRLHTTSTVETFREVTKSLGITLRHFRKVTCEDYITRELPQETAARGRRTAAKALKKGDKDKGKAPARKSAKGKAKEDEPPSKIQKLNLSTYKLHSLGDYPDAIPEVGTSDNTNTQTVSCQDTPSTYLIIYCLSLSSSTAVSSDSMSGQTRITLFLKLLPMNAGSGISTIFSVIWTPWNTRNGAKQTKRQRNWLALIRSHRLLLLITFMSPIGPGTTAS